MIRLTLAHSRAVLIGLLRTPAYWLPVTFFPVMLYTFFGASNASNPQNANLFLASWSVFAVLGIALFQFGVGMASNRESPWEGYIRTLPAGPGPRFAAQVVVATIFSSVAVALVWIAALSMSPVTLHAGQWVMLVVAILVGAIPFAMLGIMIAYLVTPRAAVPIANLLYLMLAFLGGLWVPPDNLPGAVAWLSNIVPTRHFGELAWAVVLDRPFPVVSVVVLALYGAVFATIARWAYRRDEAKRYG